jgi:hypothetical protein
MYRPVVSAINPVGPAGEPTKYAVAVSSPSVSALGLVTLVDFSGDTVIVTPNIQINPSYFILNPTGSEGFTVNTQGSLDLYPISTSLITSDVTETTLPVDLNPISMTAVTPASALSSIFIPEVSAAASGAPGTVDILNSSTAALIEPVAVGPNPVYVVGANGTPRVYVISQDTPGGPGEVDSLEAVASSGTVSNSASIPVGIAPVYGVMTSSALRAFILNQGSGTVSVVNVPSNALDLLPTPTSPSTTYTAPLGTIPLCGNPTSTVPNVPCPNTSPVWADFNTVSNELAVLNAGNATSATAQNYQGTYSASTTYAANQVVSFATSSTQTNLYLAINSGLINDAPTDTANWTLLQPGSLDIINIPLCNASTPVTNPTCSLTNPVDATGFGQIFATATVGIAPTMVSVLQGNEGNPPAAYVINQFDGTGTCGVGEGSVTVVNLASGQVTATICGVSGTAATAAANSASNVLFGHPNSVSATGGEPTGKVYVTASDNTYLSVIYTDINEVETHIPLQGTGIRVLVTVP